MTAACGRVVLATPLPAASRRRGATQPEPPGPGGSGGAGPGAGAGEPDGQASVRTRRRTPGRPRRARAAAWRTVLLLGVIALCSTYGEGAVSDWGALHLREDLGAAPGLAAAGYAAFALAEACGRLAGSALLARLGQTRVLVFGGLAHLRGNVRRGPVPGAAARPGRLRPGRPRRGQRVPDRDVPRRRPRRARNGVATASTLGYAGFLLGPPAIGFLASAA